MPQLAEKIEEVAGVDPRALPDSVLDSTRPLVLRGLAAHWPVVKAGLQGPRAAEGLSRSPTRKRMSLSPMVTTSPSTSR
jgi:hypothetical protein